MKDIRLNVNFWDHWKTISLRDQLGLGGIESLQRLWCFAAVNKPDGHLNGLSAKAIEIASRWNGKPGAFVETLETLRFLDRDGAEYALHDWNDHQAFVVGFQERSNRAKKAIAKRWHTGGITPSNTKGNEKGNTPSPLLSSPILTLPSSNVDSNKIPCPKPEKSGSPAGFDVFWAAYPRKEAKAKAIQAYKKLKPDESLLATMLEAIERWKQTDRWQRGIIPHPTTWLNGRRWEDEIQTQNGGARFDRVPADGRYTDESEL